ncbi:hypothetical protein FHW67_002399 [Herbaspirillum sp. Sphag1AN]|uniref:DUF3034 family protein n=1 Tax=unclassified Herbaspirillum TaxID=2624150 RepID=UPI00160BCB8E|nr:MULTISPECIES: DUF3034 family protein [unclassified Herbaspirillum]MBB3213110.1 hypothetical protein [Herbaspirillum sp. Sphag1AN]MBB3246307.1 hypothetical protein [Herbaspirillum sp. Sphag64]
MKRHRWYLDLSLLAVLLTAGASVSAQSVLTPDLGKLLATSGVTQVEGASGGGLVPWATITGYGSRDSYGANVHYTYVGTQDYTLGTYGAAVGIADRVELSVAKQRFTGSLAPLNNLRIEQDIYGAKLKLAGDLVYDQDSWMPQIAAGIMVKRNSGLGGLGSTTNVTQLGATSDNGIDYYLAATKLLLDQSLLLNATLRMTKADQMGLLGFGGPNNDHYQPMLEASVAYLLNRNLAIGTEYRMSPHNLATDNQKDYYDAFIAWFPSKNLSLTLAYVSLGQITVYNPKRQDGVYLSAQVGF